jgi:hypothetical protein
MADLKIWLEVDKDDFLIWKVMSLPWYKKLESKPPKDPRNYGTNIMEAFDR